MSDPMAPANVGVHEAGRPARLLLTQDLRVMPSEPPLRLLNPLPPALALPAASVLQAALSARRETPFPKQAERPEWQDWAAEDEPEGNMPDGTEAGATLTTTGQEAESAAKVPQDDLRSAFFSSPFADPLPVPGTDIAEFAPGPVPAFPGTLGDPPPDLTAKSGMLAVGDPLVSSPDPAAAVEDQPVISDASPGPSLAEDIRDGGGTIADPAPATPDQSPEASAGLTGLALALSAASSNPAPAGAMPLVEGLVPEIPGTTLVEEAVLRRLLQDALREELEGALGERITRNVRKLVRAEIARALAARDLS